jgi:hypothetical protein
MRQSSSESGLLFEEFESVAPGIFGEKAARAGERVVVGYFYGLGDQRLAQLVEIGDRESRVGLLGWLKGGFDADVELLIAALEPAATASAERSGLFDFSQAENRPVEFASGGFAVLRSGYLDVVDAHDQTIHPGEHGNQLALAYLQPGARESLQRRFRLTREFR